MAKSFNDQGLSSILWTDHQQVVVAKRSRRGRLEPFLVTYNKYVYFSYLSLGNKAVANGGEIVRSLDNLGIY